MRPFQVQIGPKQFVVVLAKTSRAAMKRAVEKHCTARTVAVAVVEVGE